MKNKSITKLVLSAAFAALICVATVMVAIPLPGSGYANLGDTLICVCAFFVGPIWGFAAAGIGSALADIILSYTIYAPATFVIKGIMAIVYIIIIRHFGKGKMLLPAALFASFISECVMVGGYFIFESFLYSPAGALPNIIGNAIQGAAGICCSTLLVIILSSNKFIKKHSSLI